MNATSVADTETLSLEKLWQVAQSGGFPLVLWQLPHAQEKHLLLSLEQQPVKQKIAFDSAAKGFAFSPFDNASGEDTYFLPADILGTYIADNQHLTFSEYPLPLSDKWLELEKQLALVHATEPEVADGISDAITELPVLGQQEAFMGTVQQAVAAIHEGQFQKVVLSRTKNYQLPPNFSAWQLFEQLCLTYRSAFISLVYIPAFDEIWMGASPEVLVTQTPDGTFTTMALAGTQSAYNPTGEAIMPADALWRQKEIEEQALVSRYIINCFKKVRVREFEEHGPKSVVAGNLMHLRTEFKVDTKAIDFPNLAAAMLTLLHPTSAVCGMPKEPSTAFILQHEPHERQFYSGYLGPVNVGNETQLYVNLRSMKISGNIATLYAGCGITIDSDAEKEWLETEMKCQTLAKVLLNTAAK